VKELILKGWCDTGDEKHLENLRKGIEQRLESKDFHDFAICIWSHLCDLLKINKKEIELPLINEEDLFKDKEIIEQPIINIPPPKETKEPILDYDENDSDNESDFEPYDIHDTYEDIKKIQPPKFLYDCILGFDSDNYQRYQYSLEYCEALVRNKPPDLEMHCKELIRRLLHASNKFEFESFNRCLIGGMIALLVEETEITLRYI